MNKRIEICAINMWKTRLVLIELIGLSFCIGSEIILGISILGFFFQIRIDLRKQELLNK